MGLGYEPWRLSLGYLMKGRSECQKRKGVKLGRFAYDW